MVNQMPLDVFNIILYSYQNGNCKDPFRLPSISFHRELEDNFLSFWFPT